MVESLAMQHRYWRLHAPVGTNLLLMTVGLANDIGGTDGGKMGKSKGPLGPEGQKRERRMRRVCGEVVEVTRG